MRFLRCLIGLHWWIPERAHQPERLLGYRCGWCWQTKGVDGSRYA